MLKLMILAQHIGLEVEPFHQFNDSDSVGVLTLLNILEHKTTATYTDLTSGDLKTAHVVLETYADDVINPLLYKVTKIIKNVTMRRDLEDDKGRMVSTKLVHLHIQDKGIQCCYAPVVEDVDMNSVKELVKDIIEDMKRA